MRFVFGVDGVGGVAILEIVLIKKCPISDQALIDGLRDLKDHGIDWNLLFPDLFGAANQANTHWDIF
ncbi:MAG: hypothetical protein IH964_03000 [Candidatus Dadabacteria bacterium]|nr:hypothetical protein [Candidatus Dadabacteria bacterium]